MIRPVVYWIPAVLYAGLVFFFSHQSDPVGATLIPDYMAHFLEYGALALTLVCGVTAGFSRHLTARTAAFAWLLAALYALSDEFHQSFIPNRYMSALDLAADGLGAALCLVVVFLANKGKWR